MNKNSMKNVISIILGFSILLLSGCGGEQVKSKENKIVLIDTASGANFQMFFKKDVIPKIEKELDIQVEYVVSSEPEVRQRLKSWGDKKDGDMHLVFLKPQGFKNMKKSGIPLTKITDKSVPNMSKIDPKYRNITQGINLQGQAATFWQCADGLLYNSEKVPNPPKSWKELYERREEFKGHIGLMRPDSKSAGGREFIYTFLNVNSVDFNKPFDQLKETKEWKDALAKFEDFSKYCYKPLASEPPVLFQQFKSGEVWLTEYAIDYTLWSRDKGLLPQTVKATFFEDGNTEGGSALFVIPDKISEEKKKLSSKVLNYLLSDEIQIELVTKMWQYPGTNIEDKIPQEVWKNIPEWKDAEKHQLKITNNKAMDYIKENGDKYLK